VHSGALESCADDDLASGLDDGAGDAEVLSAEGWVEHAVSVCLDVGDAVSSLAGAGSESGEGVEDLVDVALVEFGVSSSGPGDGERGGRAIDGLGDIGEVLFGVEEVDDLDGVWEVDFGELPDPGGSVAEEDSSLGVVESAAVGLTEDSLGEGGAFRAGVGGGRGLDGGGVGDGSGVTDGAALLVAGLGGPDGAQLGLAGLGRAVGLFAVTADELGAMHGDTGAVDGHVEGGSEGARVDGRGKDLLVLGDLGPKPLGCAFDVLGIDIDPGQLAQDRGTFVEADRSSDRTDHAHEGGGKGRIAHAQSAVARAQTVAALGAVVVGPAEVDLSEDGLEALVPASGVTSLASTGAGEGGRGVVGQIGVESLSQQPRGHGQDPSAQRGLDGLEVVESVGP